MSNFVTPINLNNFEIQNVSLQNLPSDPSPVDGKLYYNTSLNKIRFYNGTSWESIEDSGGLTGITGVLGDTPIRVVTSGTTATVSLDAATSSTPGSMSGEDKAKLDGSTSSNTPGTLVSRDQSGNFSAGTITADLDGSASRLGGQAGAHYLDRSNHTGTQTASTISDLKAAVTTYGLDEFSAPANNINLNNRRITNLAEPTQPGDAATKKYVDSSRAGLHAKAAVRAATTENLAQLSGLLTIDGVELADGDRVLVKNQSSPEDNGIYVAAAEAWARSDDADSSELVMSGMFTFVEEGNVNDNTGWVLATNNPITLGTSELDFVQFSDAGSLEVGDGLTKTGDIISAVGTANRIRVSPSGIDIDTNYSGQASITTVGTVGTGRWEADTITPTYGGTGISTYTAGSYIRAASSSTLEQRTPAQVRSDLGALEANAAITGGTHTKITYDSKGLVTSGGNLAAEDIPNIPAEKINSGVLSDSRLPVVPVSKGGTGLATVATNSFLRGNGTGALVPRTPAQVRTDLSLNNVENVAISNWTGSTNITTVGTIANGTWQGTTIAIARGGTGATTAAAARTNLGAVGRYAADVGNGTSTSIDVNHGLNSMDVTVQLYDRATGETVVSSVTRVDANRVTLGFGVAPANNAYRVVVTG